MRYLFLLFFFISQLAYASYIFSTSGGGGTWGSIGGTLSDQTDLNTALGLKATAANPVFTGVATYPDSTAAAPGIMNAGDTDTGIYWPSGDGDTMGIATAGTANILFGPSGMAVLSKAGPSTYAYDFRYSGGVQGVRFNSTDNGSSYLELASGGFGYGLFTLNTTGYKNKWRLTRLDGNYYSQWWGEMGQVYAGGSTTGQKGVTFTVEGQPDKSNIGGTTTANASTTITGSGTTFLEHVGIGDRISLSSAASTYATVTAIASNTSLTVDTALGNGTSQTINLKRAIVRWDKAAGAAVYGLVNDAGKWTIGEASTTETHVLNTATTAANSDSLTLTNGPTGKAGNPAVYIKINVNGTDRVIPAW